jgi:hypothetical protein
MTENLERIVSGLGSMGALKPIGALRSSEATPGEQVTSREEASELRLRRARTQFQDRGLVNPPRTSRGALHGVDDPEVTGWMSKKIF